MEDVKKYLNKFAKDVVSRSKSNLMGKRDTNGLYDSIGYDLDVFKNSFGLYFEMEEYGEYVDKGVKGKSSSSRAPNSPFRFGTGTGKKGGLTKSINQWVRRKGIQFKDKKTGRFLSYDSTSLLISRSIYQKGIKTSLFFTKPFEDAFKSLPDEVVEKFGLDLDKFINKSLNTDK